MATGKLWIEGGNTFREMRIYILNDNDTDAIDISQHVAGIKFSADIQNPIPVVELKLLASVDISPAVEVEIVEVVDGDG